MINYLREATLIWTKYIPNLIPDRITDSQLSSSYLFHLRIRRDREQRRGAGQCVTPPVSPSDEGLTVCLH